MLACDVENICSSLSPLLKNTIRNKILKLEEPATEYTCGEALVIWTADWLSRVMLLSADQLRLVLEEFVDNIIKAGDELGYHMYRTPPTKDQEARKKYPVCKLGFLDRKLVCMDGRDTFVDLTTGNKTKAINSQPLETVAYNLTTLFIRYNSERQKEHHKSKTAEFKGPSNGTVRTALPRHHERRG